MATKHFITLSDHAKKRGIQRFWLSPKRLRNMAEQAVTNGYSWQDAPNEDIADYLRTKAGDNKAYAYNSYVFILSERMVLITTFKLPQYLMRTLERKDTYIGVN